MINHLVAGSINWDVLIFIKKFPNIGEEIAANFIFESPGGKGGNISVSSCKILGKNKVGLLSIIGNDYTGIKQIRMLKNKGILTDFIIKNNKIESGRAFVIIDDKGKNSIITRKNKDKVIYNLFAQNINNKLRKTIIGLDAITITDLPVDFIETLLSFKCTKKRIVTWIPGLKSNLKLVKIKKVIKKINYLIINESESYQLTDSSDPVNACKKIMNIGKDLGVIVTLGENGCLFSKNSQIIKIPTINIEDMGLNTVNTAGSGDVFAGTFSSLKILNYSDKEAIQMALLAGSIKVTKKEIQDGPNLHQIFRFIKRYNIDIKRDA